MLMSVHAVKIPIFLPFFTQSQKRDWEILLDLLGQILLLQQCKTTDFRFIIDWQQCEYRFKHSFMRIATLKSVFPVFRAPSQFSLPLVAVETHTSPSSSIQNGSIPFSPDFPFPQCFLLLIHASPVPQAMVCTCNILLCIRQQGSQQVLVPIIMCSECR